MLGTKTRETPFPEGTSPGTMPAQAEKLPFLLFCRASSKELREWKICKHNQTSINQTFVHLFLFFSEDTATSCLTPELVRKSLLRTTWLFVPSSVEHPDPSIRSHRQKSKRHAFFSPQLDSSDSSGLASRIREGTPSLLNLFWRLCEGLEEEEKKAREEGVA